MQGDLRMGEKNAIDKEITRKIRLFGKLLKKAKIPVESLILFGSQVKDKAKPYSDIDVCVVSPLFGKDTLKERVRISMLADKVDWRIEPHPYHPQDFAVEEDPFAWEIKRTGKKIRI